MRNCRTLVFIIGRKILVLNMASEDSESNLIDLYCISLASIALTSPLVTLLACKFRVTDLLLLRSKFEYARYYELLTIKRFLDKMLFCKENLQIRKPHR